MSIIFLPHPEEHRSLKLALEGIITTVSFFFLEISGLFRGRAGRNRAAFRAGRQTAPGVPSPGTTMQPSLGNPGLPTWKPGSSPALKASGSHSCLGLNHRKRLLSAACLGSYLALRQRQSRGASGPAGSCLRGCRSVGVQKESWNGNLPAGALIPSPH